MTNPLHSIRETSSISRHQPADDDEIGSLKQPNNGMEDMSQRSPSKYNILVGK